MCISYRVLYLQEGKKFVSFKAFKTREDAQIYYKKYNPNRFVIRLLDKDTDREAIIQPMMLKILKDIEFEPTHLTGD